MRRAYLEPFTGTMGGLVVGGGVDEEEDTRGESRHEVSN